MMAMILHRLCRCGLLLLIVSFTASAQSEPAAKADPDRLGKSCAQILAMSSSEWVAKFTEERGATPDATVRAIHAYGKCYDARTDRLAASLAKSGQGPRLVARKEFASLEQALNDFTAKAIAATDPPADAVRTAYATLYEKQFRASFYENFVEHISSHDYSSAAPEDAGDVGKAKNHFGKLLETLPEDKLHEVHKAFANVLNHAVFGEEVRLQVYLYAIFCLETSFATPFSAAPF